MLLEAVGVVVMMMIFGGSCQSQPSCRPLDVVVTLDSSGSICHRDPFFVPGRDTTCHNWAQLVSFVRAFVDTFNVASTHTQISLVMFANDAHIQWRLNRYSDKASLLQAVGNLRFSGGWTNTGDALFKTIQAFRGNGERPSVENVAFIITDSHPTINVAALPFAISAIRQANIQVYAIGVTNYIDETTLKSLSSPPQKLNENYFKSSLGLVINLIPVIMNRLCSSVFTPGPHPTVPLKQKTTTPSVLIQTPTRDNCVTSKKDVVFVVDASGSICERDPNFKFGQIQTCDNWKDLVNFIHDIANSFNIGPNHIMVGLVMFNESARIVWKLDRYPNKGDLLTAIKALQYIGGFTNTGEALVKLMQSFGGPEDRPDAPNVALVVTDAMSTLDPGKLKLQLEALRFRPIRVYALGVTGNVDRIALKSLSSYPQILNQNYFLSSSYSEIAKIREQVEERVCSDVTTTTTTTTTTQFQPVISYTRTRCYTMTLPPTTTTTTTTTSTTKTTTTARTTTTTTTTATTTTTTTVYCNNEVLDVVLALDASGSICDTDPTYVFGRDKTCQNWRQLLSFVSAFVNSFNVGTGRSLFSLVMFHSLSEVKWDLNRYFNKADLLRDIENLPYVGGWTDTAGGLRRILEVLNGPSNRRNIPDVAIIITDGEPTTNLNDLPHQLNLLRAQGVKTFAVGVTAAINEGTLRSLSSPPHLLNQNYFMSATFSQVGQLKFAIRDQICKRN